MGEPPQAPYLPDEAIAQVRQMFMAIINVSAEQRVPATRLIATLGFMLGSVCCLLGEAAQNRAFAKGLHRVAVDAMREGMQYRKYVPEDTDHA